MCVSLTIGVIEHFQYLVPIARERSDTTKSSHIGLKLAADLSRELFGEIIQPSSYLRCIELLEWDSAFEDVHFKVPILDKAILSRLLF